MSSIFDSVNKFFSVGSPNKGKDPKGKTQAEKDDDIKYRNKFRDGPNDPPAPKKNNNKKESASGILKVEKALKDAGV